MRASRVVEALPTPASFDQPRNHEENYGADRGGNDLSNQARAKTDAQRWKQQTGKQSANDANYDVADQPKTGSLYDKAGKPARDRADQQYDDQTFSGDTHVDAPQLPYLLIRHHRRAFCNLLQQGTLAIRPPRVLGRVEPSPTQILERAKGPPLLSDEPLAGGLRATRMQYISVLAPPPYSPSEATRRPFGRFRVAYSSFTVPKVMSSLSPRPSIQSQSSLRGGSRATPFSDEQASPHPPPPTPSRRSSS
jgi:hypothetical protein